MITNDLYQRVANTLSGRPVELRWRKLICPDCVGQSYIANERAFIDLKPGLTPDEAFKGYSMSAGIYAKAMAPG